MREFVIDYGNEHDVADDDDDNKDMYEVMRTRFHDEGKLPSHVSVQFVVDGMVG